MSTEKYYYAISHYAIGDLPGEGRGKGVGEGRTPAFELHLLKLNPRKKTLAQMKTLTLSMNFS